MRAAVVAQGHRIAHDVESRGLERVSREHSQRVGVADDCHPTSGREGLEGQQPRQVVHLPQRIGLNDSRLGEHRVDSLGRQ